jgi:lysophospholipase L1-like esterase
MILATLAVVLALMLVRDVPHSAAHRAQTIRREESLKRAESLKIEEFPKLVESLNREESLKREARPAPPIEASPNPSPTPVVTLKEVFDYGLADYKAKLDQLDANIKLQALFIVFTVLLVLRRSDSLNLFGNQLPLQWLHLFVPVAMIYLWLNFGFMLDYLIHSRLWGVESLKVHSPSMADYGKLLFQDSGFVDGWFLSFIDTKCINGKCINPGDYSGIDHNSQTSTATLLVLVFGTLLSAAHAGIIGMAFIGCRRYLRRLSRRFFLLYYLLPLIPIALLIVSHLQFVYGGSNRNYIQLYIAFMTIPLVAILLWVSVVVDSKVDPDSVACLRRQRRLEKRRSIHDDDDLRFKTMALLGDSLSTRFYVGSLPGMLLRMWRAWKGTWFAAAPADKLEIGSIFERLSTLAPISATVHASARAKVDADGNRTLFDLLSNTRHLSHQVDEVLLGEFPDLLLLWIGHNNIDWHSRVPELTDQSCDDLATEFTNCYKHQLERLLKGALRSKKRIVLVVYGLINFESFFQARAEAERLRTADPTKYPYLEKDYEYFSSMKPEHRNGMVRLAQLCNEKLKEMCRGLDEEIRKSDVLLSYSDALSRAEISEAQMINQSDAWHPSSAGHRVLAERGYEPIKEEFSYLGWAGE